MRLKKGERFAKSKAHAQAGGMSSIRGGRGMKDNNNQEKKKVEDTGNR